MTGTRDITTRRARDPDREANAPVAEEPGGQERRARDAAMALPLLGILLLASPLTGAFGVEGTLIGVPVVVVYVFVTWAALIWGAWRIGRRLRSTAPTRRRRPS
ncbi:MAG: hypothetical protein AAF577_08155 [Pseudomonadota bacterium]